MKGKIKINWEKTAALYGVFKNFSRPSPPSILFDKNLCVRSRAYRFFSKLYRMTTKRDHDLYHQILKIQAAIQNHSKEQQGRVNIILRVDDFPRWDIPTERFLRFRDIILEYNIPIILGVTPLIAGNPLDPFDTKCRDLTEEEIIIIRELTNCGSIVALHGLTHRVSIKGGGEYIGLTEAEVEDNIKKSLKEMEDAGITTNAIIPPFNAFDATAFLVFGRYFKAVFGGPESIATFGGYFGPVFLNDTLYLPSYRGLYGRAFSIKEHLLFYEWIFRQPKIYYPPITIHWAWELEDGYMGVKELFSHLRNLSDYFNLNFSADLPIHS